MWGGGGAGINSPRILRDDCIYTFFKSHQHVHAKLVGLISFKITPQQGRHKNTQHTYNKADLKHTQQKSLLGACELKAHPGPSHRNLCGPLPHCSQLPAQASPVLGAFSVPSLENRTPRTSQVAQW